MQDLTNEKKVWLITGMSRGPGKELARAVLAKAEDPPVHRMLGSDVLERTLAKQSALAKEVRMWERTHEP
jgi:NAD(P)-dependent dehydrogenase (short-subunit alcohol dehydrogenase family)